MVGHVGAISDEHAQSSLAGKNILVIGSRSQRHFLQQALVTEGAKVLTYRTNVPEDGLTQGNVESIIGDFALGRFSPRPDMAVICSPIASGNEVPENNPAINLALQIKEKEVPVIALNTSGASTDATRLLRKHGIAYLASPGRLATQMMHIKDALYSGTQLLG